MTGEGLCDCAGNVSTGVCRLGAFGSQQVYPPSPVVAFGKKLLENYRQKGTYLHGNATMLLCTRTDGAAVVVRCRKFAMLQKLEMRRVLSLFLD
jgi:hypothetical protein